MNYTPSPHINPNKIFLIKRSELDGRYDPKYIEPLRLEFYTKLRNSKNVVKLKEIIKEGSYGVLPPGDSYNVNLPIKFIRATELKEDLKIDFENVYFVERKYYTKRAAIKQHDILLAVKGATIAGNKCVSFVSENVGECIVNGSIFRMQINEKANPLYVAYLLNSDLLKRQMKFNLVANNAVDYLDKSLIYNLLIPLPSIEEQEKIVALFQTAYTAKQQKEAEAKALLESIDTYLLGELGISLPEQDHSLEKRIFITKYSEVAGKRFDSYYYTNDFYQLEGQLSKSKYRYIPFSDVVQSISNGFDFRDYKDSGTPYIKVANVKPGEFDFTKIQYIDFNSSELVKKIQLKKGNLLLTRKGTFGNALALTEDYDYIISSEVFYIELKQDVVESGYLEIFLNSYIGQKQFDRIKIGAIMGSLSQEALKFMQILLPPLEKQTEIANHIQSIRSQAKALQHEATRVLEEAKREVEKMILGE